MWCVRYPFRPVTSQPAASDLSGRAIVAGTVLHRRMTPVIAAVAMLFPAVAYAEGQAELTLQDDMVLATDALLMPINAPYGRAINDVSFQTEPFLTYNGYQYAAWYRVRSSNYEDLMLARRNLSGTTWESFNTNKQLVNGDSSGSDGASAWDAHCVVSIGVSGDGRMHMAWDMHNSTLRYMDTVTGVVTSPGGTWDTSILNAERNSLNVGGPAITQVTYPMFITKPGGDLIGSYRVPGGPGGGSGNGLMMLATYDAAAGLWDTPHAITSNAGLYTDILGSSTTRNAYLNGLNIGPDGNIHITWTWREDAGGANHDIMYAYSDDGGDTWRNNDGTIVGTVGSPMSNESPGVTIAAMDRTNTLMNQQAQTVAGDGGVHAIMWHRRFDEPGYEWQPGDAAFYTSDAAYYHYYRNPDTGVWSRSQLPVTRAVGSRPDVAYDQDNNLYVVYLSPGPGDGVGVKDYYTDGDLIIAGATKASNYTDWSILLTDTRDFAGEPFIDQTRLLEDGILSVFVQENSDANTGRTGTSLHVLEYEIQFPMLAGDYNDDGIVDAADYTVWRDNLGAPAGTLPNDSDGGTIGPAQFATWKANFGMTAGSGAGLGTAVPEPAAWLPAVLALACLCSLRRSFGVFG